MTPLDDPAIRARTRAILAAQLGLAPDRIAARDTPDTLGLGSMHMVEVIFAIEEAFDIDVPFNANAPGHGGFDISTVAAIEASVLRLVHDAHG